MKRFIIIVTVLLSIVVFGIHVPAEGGPKVLLIPREGDTKHEKRALTKEVGVMTNMLKEAGFEVVVATVKGKPIVAYPFPVTTLEPDLKLKDVNVADYVGFIMPCMAVPRNWPVAPEAVAIVKQAVAEGKPVAAQLGSVAILAESGVLKGKKYAYFYDSLNPDSGHQRDDRFEGAIYSDEIVVKDGNIITSCCCPAAAHIHGGPDATAQLTQTLIDELIHK